MAPTTSKKKTSITTTPLRCKSPASYKREKGEEGEKDNLVEGCEDQQSVTNAPKGPTVKINMPKLKWILGELIIDPLGPSRSLFGTCLLSVRPHFQSLANQSEF